MEGVPAGTGDSTGFQVGKADFPVGGEGFAFCAQGYWSAPRTKRIRPPERGRRKEHSYEQHSGDLRLANKSDSHRDFLSRLERVLQPLRKDSVQAPREWLRERRGDGDQPLFPSSRNRRLNRDTVAWIVRKHAARASQSCPSLWNKRVSPHCLRHTAAMSLLRQGVPITVIALWLGHRSVETAMKYLHADPKLKEDAMERTRPVDVPPGRYRSEEQVMAFLEGL